MLDKAMLSTKAGVVLNRSRLYFAVRRRPFIHLWFRSQARRHLVHPAVSYCAPDRVGSPGKGRRDGEANIAE